jgi:hypothetical protein
VRLSKDKGTLSAAQNLTINANESITNGETIQNNEFLVLLATMQSYPWLAPFLLLGIGIACRSLSPCVQ